MDKKTLLDSFYDYSLHSRLPSQKKILSLAKKAIELLENESPDYREKIPGTQIAGGFLDFRSQKAMPLIVVPDIHARPDFIYNILNFVLPKKLSGFREGIKIIEALEEKKIRVLLVGDILHAEGRARARWEKAFWAYDTEGEINSRYMREEMREGLAALLAVMQAKILWPENFHCLKGNHENIKNERGEGNFPFRKFVMEGQMVFDFMRSVYEPEVLESVYAFEKSLPFAYCSKNIFVSHAEPMDFFERSQLVEAALDESVVYGLTWTANDEAKIGSVSKTLDSYCNPPAGVQARYIGGHRPVPENYLLRQGGLYVQIHNPRKQNVAVVRPTKTFNPEKDIISVENI